MADNQLVLAGVSPSIEGLSWQTNQRMRVGRQAKSDIVINDPSLGEQHAEIRLTPQGWVVQDLGSAGGTFLNGVRLGKQARKLQPEDVLQCGRLTFKVAQAQWKPPAASPQRTSHIKTSGPVVRVQAHTQLSWEQGLHEGPLEEAQSPHARQFLTLLRAGYHLSRIDSLDELLQSLLDDTVAVLDAQRGSIVLAEETTGQLSLRTSLGRNRGNGRLGFSNTLAQRRFSNGESLLCLDNQADLPRSASMDRSDMSSIICALLRSPRRRLGVLHLDRGPLQAPFSQDDFRLANAIAATVSVGIESAVGVEKQRGHFLQEVLELAQRVMAARDAATARHCRRVCAIALLLADELRLPAPEKSQLQLGALLHDLGKIGVPDRLLGLVGTLTPEEEKQLRGHPLQGVALAETISAFAPALPIIRSHHERWDGKGYPDGLQGEQIPRLARVVAVADALDDLSTAQPCESDLPMSKVLKFFAPEAEHRFDPDVVRALLGLGPRLEELLRATRLVGER